VHNKVHIPKLSKSKASFLLIEFRIESLTFDLTRGEFQKNSFINDPENQSIMVGGPNQTGGGSLHH
jgi:hypothetical protein